MSLRSGLPVPVSFFVLTAALAVGTGTFVGWLAWTHAPPAGGEFWPYLRVVVTCVAFAVGVPLGLVTGVGITWLSLVLGGEFE